MIVPAASVVKYWRTILTLGFAVMAIVFIFSLTHGAVAVSAQAFFAFLAGEADAQTATIIVQLRVPRALLAALVGAVLAASGAVTQGLFRNPLADPSLIGVSAGAAAGASVMIVLLNHYQWSYLGLSLVSLAAFVGGMIAVVLVYRLATGPSGTSVATMLLAGIAMTFIAGSITSVLEFIADNEMLRRISLWRMGGLEAADYTRVGIMTAVALPIFLVLPRFFNPLNALLLGESEARHLGVDIHRVKKILVITVAAGVGTSVALAGSIAFIGLVVPHIVRMLIGPNHRYLLPLSALMGASLLIVADTFARTVIAPTELPVGLVTAIIGAPVFISLLRRRHHYGLQ